MSNSDVFLVVVVAVAFIAGYSIVSFVVKRLKGDGKKSDISGQSCSGNSEPKGSTNDSWRAETNEEKVRHAQYRQQEQARRTNETWEAQNEDQKYAKALGISGRVAPEDIKRAYRELLAKYHPDKVCHLGEEFRGIAENRTREIIAAYEFLRKKYDIR